MELQLNLEQKQVISQRMVQSMEILQMNTLELENYIENLALENPVIELPAFDERKTDIDIQELERKSNWLAAKDFQNRAYYRQDNLTGDAWDNMKSSAGQEESLENYLFLQLFTESFSETENEILEYIIYSLDERGYFTDDIKQTAEKFSVSEKEILRILSYVQELDPPGIAARDLRECLLLQLQRSGRADSLAKELILYCLPELAKNHLQSAAKKIHAAVPDVEKAYELIKQLNPKPANSFAAKEEAFYIRPDCLVLNQNGRLELIMNEKKIPEFSINEYYAQLFKTTKDKETKKYLQEKITQAKWVSECISQRKSTLRRVLEEVVNRQTDFFFKGEGHKSPMSLSELSESLNLHESTISRAMKGKYLQCSFGVYPLNYFLTQISVRSQNLEALTAEQIKIRIKDIINKENGAKPYSDQEISDLLEKDGIKISRRTVNKYRSELGIPDKSGRKKILSV